MPGEDIAVSNGGRVLDISPGVIVIEDDRDKLVLRFQGVNRSCRIVNKRFDRQERRPRKNHLCFLYTSNGLRDFGVPALLPVIRTN